MVLKLSARSILSRTFFETAKKLHTTSLVCWAQPLVGGVQKGQVFIAISKKCIAKAVQRNRLKRILRSRCHVHPAQPLRQFTLFLSVKSSNEAQITRDIDTIIHKLSTQNPKMFIDK